MRSIMNPPVFSRFNHDPRYPPLGASRSGALARKQFTFPHRTGITAIKQGMMGVFDKETGERIPCTVLQLDAVQVVGHKTKKEHGYYAVQIGSGWRHYSNVTRAELGHFHRQGVSPKSDVTEFRVKGKEGLVPVGTVLRADWLIEGQYVDVQATCKGKGFAGVSDNAGNRLVIAHRPLGYEEARLGWTTGLAR